MPVLDRIASQVNCLRRYDIGHRVTTAQREPNQHPICYTINCFRQGDGSRVCRVAVRATANSNATAQPRDQASC